MFRTINEKSSVLTELITLDDEEIRSRSRDLRNYYDEDLEISFEDELLHFQAHCTQKGIEKYTPLNILKFLRQNDLYTVYPNVEIAYRMIVCTPVTNCSAERSFSCLKRIKNYLRSTMTRLNALAVLSIESELLLSLDCEDIINNFAVQKARRKVV